MTLRRLTLLLMLVMLAGSGRTAPISRDIVMNVIVGASAWTDSDIETKLKMYLTRKADIRVNTVDSDNRLLPPFPGDIYDFDSLLNWGREVGGRYLLVVEVFDQRLERRKSFHVPLVFHKYETVGVIEGELRLIDLSKGKAITVEPFKVELNGPRSFQATMDDDINDPDLHLTAPDKIRFFQKLEDLLCKRLADRVSSLANGR